MRIKHSITVPGDKSISHRALMMACLAMGTSRISRFLVGEDCLATMDVMRAMGVRIDLAGTTLTVEGHGLKGLKAPAKPLDAKNSGTTMRLLMGILSGQDFPAQITGDDSLSRRPMRRVIEPLTLMGARITAADGNYPPVNILKKPHNLKGIEYQSPIASAQVKSAILLAGLFADGPTTVGEPHRSRDHTERMFHRLGIPVKQIGDRVEIHPVKEINAFEMSIPGDFSSAAFFIVAALIVPESELTIRNVGLNPTRLGLVNVLKKMGGRIRIENISDQNNEPVGDILIETSRLHGIDITSADIPSLIDEIPILTVAASCAAGKTRISGAEELRVKESDRLHALAVNLETIGVKVEEKPDGLVIQGQEEINGGIVESFGDHRIAMAMEVAGLVANNAITVQGKECVNISFPQFYDTLKTILG